MGNGEWGMDITSMYNPPLLMQTIQRQEETPHQPPEYLNRERLPRKRLLPLPHTHPQRRVHKTPMFPIRTIELKRLVQPANVRSTFVLRGGEGALQVRVDVCFAVGVAGGVGDADFEGVECFTAVEKFRTLRLKGWGKGVYPHPASRHNHTVECRPNPNFPRILYSPLGDLITSPICAG
jgi:hypothetical protein